MQRTLDILKTAYRSGIEPTMDLLFHKEQNIPGSILFNMNRYYAQQPWITEDTGMMVYHYNEAKSEDNYLDRIEDYRDRLTYTLSDQIKVDSWGHQENLESLHLKNLAADLLGCQVDIMFDTVLGLDSRDLLSFTNEDLLTNKDLMFLSPRNSFKSARIFVFNCKNSKDTFVMETKI